MVAAFRKSICVVIGIDHYQNGIPELRSAVNDARRLGVALQKDHGYECISLLDEQANAASLEDLLTNRLPGCVGEDDRVIFYFAGHGVALDGDDGPRGFVLPQDAVRGKPDTYIEMTRLHDDLMALPCRHMLIVLDSCFSGAFRWSSTRDVQISPGIIHQERYERFVHDSSWQVLTSAAYDQTAADQLLTGNLGTRGGEGAHSPFALALFDALTGAADLVPEGGDGIITATELYLYLEDRLQPESMAQGCRQTPGLWPLRKHDKGEYIFLVPGRDLLLPAAPILNYDNNPYLGLASYNKKDAGLFFGREAAVEKLASQVEAQALTVVLGASGTGKSSLVKAGLVPVLEAKGWHRLPVMRPGDSPFLALANVLSANGVAVAATREGITSAFKLLQQAENSHNLLIIDQFEELITQTRSTELRTDFLKLLSELVETAGSGLRIVVTLRSDYEAHFDQSDLNPTWSTGRYIVPAMSRQDYRAIIEGPTSERVLYFDPPSLVETLLDEVTAMPGGLPLLSFTLSEMYRSYVDRKSDDRALSQSDYDALGGVVGSLRTRADEEYKRLDPLQRETLRRVMLRMMVMEHGMPARQRVSRQELEQWDPEESERLTFVLQRFGEARLLVEGVSDEGMAYVEPAHDALVASWGRLLEWVHQAQTREPDLHFLHTLSRTALEWQRADKRSRPGLLWRDKVHSARLWAMRKTVRIQFNRIEDEFCRASVARRRLLRNGVLILLTTITLSGVLATIFGIVAVEQRNEALQQTRQAWASALAAKASTALDGQGNSTLAIKLAAAALQVDPYNDRAIWYLRKAFYGNGLSHYQGQVYSSPLYKQVAQDVFEGRWSPDGSHIVLLSKPGESWSELTMKVISTDGEVLSEIVEDYLSLGDFSENGQYILLYDEYLDEVNAWDLSGHQVSKSFAASLRPSAPSTREVVYEGYNTTWYQATAPDGRTRAGHLASRGNDHLDNQSDYDIDLGTFEITRDGALINTVPGEWNEVAISRDGKMLATGNFEGDLTLWRIVPDWKQAERVADLWRGNGSDRLFDMEFSPDGLKLLTASGNGVARIWDLAWNPLRLGPLEQSTGPSNKNKPLKASLNEEGLGNDTPRASVTVTDERNGASWTRNLIASFVSVAVMDDIVTILDDDGIRLFNPKGIEEVSIPLSRADMSWDWGETVLSGQSNSLYLGTGDEGNFVTLPLSHLALIEIAKEGGYLNLSTEEQSRWATVLPDSLGLSSTDDGQNSSLFTMLLQFFGVYPKPDVRDQEPGLVEVSQPEVFLLPPPWQILGTAMDEFEGWSGNPLTHESVRWIITELRDRGVLEAVMALGAPEPFIDWNQNSATESFRHYNPAFLQWIAETLLPEHRNLPIRRATQFIYDQYFRRHVRVHSLALSALDEDPRLLEAVKQGYADTTSDRGKYLHQALTPVADALGLRPEGEPDDLIWAAGFWVRRGLDHTEPEFRQGLMKTLTVYDPDFLADWPLNKNSTFMQNSNQ